MTSEERVALAAEAYVYGFPLTFNLEQVERFTRVGMGGLPAAPFNVFSHASQLAGPEDTFVSINNDTVYSIAQLDVSGGPVRLAVPDSAGRYYVLQFVDAWTNNFAYVGHRATGTEAGTYLLVAPDWDGAADGSETVIRLPTMVATIVGRWAVDGEDDLAAVGELQSQLTLTATGHDGVGLPSPEGAVDDVLLPFERIRAWMQAFPPAQRDKDYQERFAPLGLLDSSSPYVEPDAGLAGDLAAGLQAGKQQMHYAMTHGASPKVNGWTLTYHVFDYNLDFFEVGTIDDPRWKLADTSTRFIERALSAQGGLWGNHGYEAAYAMVWEDGDGEQLDGTRSYKLRFASPPPVGAFWSVTMYDLPEFFLVENPISRYSIGDRTPGLSYAKDGSLTITMQREAPPSAEEQANWLPTPAGPFRPILRMYEPHDSIFDGEYEIPPVVRAD